MIMLNEQYLLIAGLIVAFSAFSQGFLGLGFGIIAVAGIGFTSWDIEKFLFFSTFIFGHEVAAFDSNALAVGI